MIRHINESVAVAPQISPEDVAAIKAAGFVAIINNRPDDEQPGQPSGEAIRAAAEAEGLAYTAIPVTPGGFSHEQVDQMMTALVAAGGPVLAYCRSGTRSCNLWALAAAKAGRNPELLVMQAEAAGYDLSGIRPVLDTLRGRAMIWLIGGGAAAALLMIAAGVWRLRRQPAGIDSVEDVAEAAEAALPGFRVTGAVVGADGQGALAVSEEGRVAVCRRRGRQLAVCEVAWSRVRATASGIMIDTGQRRFGSVTVAGVNALDVRRLSPLAARELMAAA